jgi:hypothetical protein
MTAMITKGGTGAGAVLSIGSGGAGETFTPILQIKTFQLPEAKWAYDDVTNAGSPSVGPGVLKENLPATVDCGEGNFGGTWLPSDPGQLAVSTAFSTGVPTDFKLQLKPIAGQLVTGNLYTFSGYVQTNPVPDIQADKTATIKLSIKLTTLISVTPGA